MKAKERKAAVAAYKERRATAGIYAVRCAPTGRQWIGRAPDLSTVQNRLWFTLRHGDNPNRSLQDEWNAHGADSFTFDELERLEDEKLSYVREAALKDRLAHWLVKLNASAI